MNKIPEVLKLINLKVDEAFLISDTGSPRKYRVNGKGIVQIYTEVGKWKTANCSLISFLNGSYVVRKIRWRNA